MQNGQLIDEILTMIVAGHETTASTLNWAWYLISQHPEVENRLSNELDTLTTCSELVDLPRFLYTRQVIDETMRLYPAGWLLTRKALRNDQLGEYSFRLELKSMFHLISFSGIPIYGRNQIASIQTAFDLITRNGGIDWR